MTTRKRVVEAARKRSAPQVIEIRVRVLHDEDPDTSFMDTDDPEDEDRRKAFQRGDFTFVGVLAEADVVIEGVSQTIKSGGLWGTESDSGEKYLEEIAGDEYSDLRKILISIGVPTSQVPTRFDPSWIQWEV